MKRILCTFTALLITLSLTACLPSRGGLSSVESLSIDRNTLIGEHILAAENEYLELWFEPYMTWFTIVDKITGEVWRSNPENAADAPLTNVMISRLQSLLVINFANIEGVTTLLDSYGFSVDINPEDEDFNEGRYNYEILDNGFAVHFTITNEPRHFYIPEAVPEWRMDEITANMSDADIRQMRNMYYRIYDIEKLSPTRDNKDELLAKYQNPNCTPERPLNLENTKIYVMNPELRTFLRRQAEELFSDHYSKEEYYADLMFYESDKVSSYPTFNVSIRIELDGYGFTAVVDYDNIEYLSEFPPVDIRILPFFGAGSLEDEGFMLVPDGSGALIHFNNGKDNQSPYINPLYGWDMGLYREAIVLDPKAHFPVFGIEKNGSALICVIEEGSAYASIRANVSGMTESGPYNNVYAEYSLIHREGMEISGKSDKNVVIFQSGLPEGERIVQRYMFAAGTNTDTRPGYMAMAETYREYLMERHPHLQKSDTSEVPVAVEILGAVNKNNHILGFPVEQPFRLTSYREAADIVNDLNKRGFGSVYYRLTGWFNKSVLHEVPTNVNLISQLGSRRDFDYLVSTINNDGSNLFLEADFMFMRNNKALNGFNINRDASRFINRKRIEAYPYSFIWYGEFTRDWSDMLSHIARPAYTMELIDGFMKQIANLGASNVSFRSIGNNLAGDYNERRFVSREASMNMQTAKLRELLGAGHSIMLQNGYAYAAPYASFITDFPLSWQGYGVLDEAIPFYQIVLHGLVPYAGRPVNLAADFELNLLQSLETGAGLYFTFMHESPEILQTSRFLTFYANQYSTWADTAERVHREFAEQVGDIYNQFITDYVILSHGVSVTTYENNVRVAVNKSNAPFTYEGRTIPAKDYIVIREGS
jgi:hypothetical protein